MNVERIYSRVGGVLAVVYKARGACPSSHGISFLTEPEAPQQMAVMSWPAGHVIHPHVHPAVRRELYCPTWEVLSVVRGEIVLDLYEPDGERVRSVVLSSGDLVLLCSGGHGFRVVRDCEMVEVKLGPYAGDDDKRPLSTPLPLGESRGAVPASGI